MRSNRLRLILARTQLEAARDRARRKMQGTLDRKARGVMETRGIDDDTLDRLLTSEKVIRGIERDIRGTP